jgi:hypothetical protein
MSMHPKRQTSGANGYTAANLVVLRGDTSYGARALRSGTCWKAASATGPRSGSSGGTVNCVSRDIGDNRYDFFNVPFARDITG